MRIAATTMDTLSTDFGPTLGLVCASLWLMAFGVLCEALNSLRAATFFNSFFCACLPVLVVSVCSETSDQCDKLLRGLNKKVMDDPTQVCFDKVQILKRTLGDLNLGQGIGFKM